MEEAHAQGEEEIDKREGRVDVFFRAREGTRLALHRGSRRSCRRRRVQKSTVRRRQGQRGSRRVQGPEQLQPAVIKQKIEQSLKDREELEDEIAACVEEDTGCHRVGRVRGGQLCRVCPGGARLKKLERKTKAKKLVGLEETDGLPGEYDIRVRGRDKLEISTASPRLTSSGRTPLLHGHFLEARAALNVIMWGFLIINVFAIAGAKIAKVTLPTDHPGVRRS